MKFDSYTRFLKSPLYQECILAEVEGRSLPDAQRVPSSPASKHSVGSDHSNVSTPKKVPAPRPTLLDGSCPVDLGCPTGHRVGAWLPSRADRPGRAVSGAAVRLLLWTRAGATPWPCRVVSCEEHLLHSPSSASFRSPCHFKVTSRGFNNVFHSMAAEWKIEVGKIPE